MVQEAIRLDVWFCVKDPGGMGAVLPILDKLHESSGLTHLLIPNGKALELVGEREHVVVDSLAALLQNFATPRVLVTSMCSGGGLGRDLIPILRPQGTIVIAVQDYWGAYLADDWSELLYRPDYIMVNDELAKDIVLMAWPEFNPDKVLVTGQPAFDKYADIYAARIEEEVRHKLGLDADLPIIVFGGQGEGTAASLDALIDALNAAELSCFLIPRPHPRTRQNFAAEMQPWQKALARFRSPHVRLVVDWFNQCTTSDLIAACRSNGVVVSMFSTMLPEAACLRVPTIATLFPQEGMRVFRAAVPWATESNMSTMLGCALVARDHHELVDALAVASGLMGSIRKQREEQERAFPVGCGATRALAEILKILD